MKSAWMLIAAIVLAAPAARGADVETFHKSWAAARAEAVKEGKPIYLHFTTNWCTWCRRIEKDTYASEVGAAALKNFVAASLDCTGPQENPAARANLELMRRFGGEGFPFLVMVTPEQVVLETVNGYVKPEPFAATLAKAQATFKQWKAFKDWAATADKKSYEYQRRAMAIYTLTRQVKRAAGAALRIRKLDPDNAKGDAAAASLALLKAAASEPPSPQRDRRVASLGEEVRRFDPDDAKGVLQQALVVQVKLGLAEFIAVKDAARREALLKTMEERLNELDRLGKGKGKGKKVPDAQMLWAYFGQANAMADRKAQALLALKKAVALDPDSPIAGRIKALIRDIETGS